MTRTRFRAFKCRQGVHRLGTYGTFWSRCKDCHETIERATGRRHRDLRRDPVTGAITPR